jgi:hypothetical protein
VAYEVDVASVCDELEALPHEALGALAAVLDVLEAAPWSGDVLVDRNPDGAVRTMPFGGTGLATYVVVERFGRVDLLQLHWVGWAAGRARAVRGPARRVGALGMRARAATTADTTPRCGGLTSSVYCSPSRQGTEVEPGPDDAVG